MPNTHSPLPWRPVDFGGIYDARNDTVVGCALYEPNAAMIVRAVNSHDKLVEALEAMLITFGTHTDALARSTIAQARAALKLAKGE